MRISLADFNATVDGACRIVAAVIRAAREQ